MGAVEKDRERYRSFFGGGFLGDDSGADRRDESYGPGERLHKTPQEIFSV